MCLEQTVEEVEKSLPVDAIEGIVDGIGEDASLDTGLEVFLITLRFGYIRVRRVAARLYVSHCPSTKTMLLVKLVSTSHRQPGARDVNNGQDASAAN